MWILISDHALAQFGLASDSTVLVNLMKGLGFVVVTAAVLYAYLYRVFERRRKLEDDLRTQIAVAQQSKEAMIQAQQSGLRNHLILQRIFDNSLFLLAYMDAQFNFIQVNERYALADNKTPAYFVGKNHFDLYPHPENEALFRRVVETGEAITIYAKPFGYPNNPERPVTYWDWSLVPVRGDSDRVDGLILTLFNVTDRVMAEKQLHIKESAIASSIIPIALADMQGRLTYVNDAFLRLWKLDGPQAALDRPALDFWVDREAAQAVIVSISQGSDYRGELKALLADGTSADVELIATLVRDAEGEPVCMMGSFNDITRQKQAEQYALENEGLKARFQKEQERNALVQRIISMLSHDTRTPLSIISTVVDMLKRHIDKLTPESRQEKLDTIERQVQFTLELLKDTVNTARGSQESGFHPAPVKIAALCQVSVEEIQAARHSSRRLEFVNLTDIQTAQLDEVLVSRILLNLLSNALKYSSADSEVRLEMDQGDGWLILRVVDQGVGIREEDLPNIFDPFFRARDVRNIQGTGLGLSIVKDCVERHQGRISVTSQVGQGSVFTVALPLVRDDLAESLT
jgi:PAS domain S-box-containing protein